MPPARRPPVHARDSARRRRCAHSCHAHPPTPHSERTLSPTLAGEDQVTALPDQVAVEPLDAGIMDRLATPEVVDRDLSTDRDPFAMWQPAPITDEAALIEEFVDDGIIDRETMCADWQTEVDEIAFMLNLKSVLGGGTPRALVNIEGVLLTIGETFDITDTDIEFQVEGTARRSVRLGAYNAELDCWHEVEVSMDAD